MDPAFSSEITSQALITTEIFSNTFFLNKCPVRGKMLSSQPANRKRATMRLELFTLKFPTFFFQSLKSEW